EELRQPHPLLCVRQRGPLVGFHSRQRPGVLPPRDVGEGPAARCPMLLQRRTQVGGQRVARTRHREAVSPPLEAQSAIPQGPEEIGERHRQNSNVSTSSAGSPDSGGAFVVSATARSRATRAARSWI